MALVRIRYKNHSVTRSVPLRVEYTCSKCGYNASVRHTVSVSSTQNSSMTANSSEINQKLSDSSLNAITQKMDKIVEEYKKGEYDTLELKIKCPSCKHKEPWSKLGMSKIGCLLVSFSGLLFFGAVLLLINGDSFVKDILPCLGTGVGVFVLYTLYESLVRKHMYKKIAKLPKESLPKIYLEKQNKF